MHKVDCKDHHYPDKSQQDLSDVSSLRTSSMVAVSHLSCHGPLKPSSPHWGGQKRTVYFSQIILIPNMFRHRVYVMYQKH